MDSVKIQNLINYAKVHLGLDKKDEIYTRNRLLEAVKEIDFFPCEGDMDVANLSFPDSVINPVLDDLVASGKIEEGEREEVLCRIMDILSLKPSEIEKNFEEIYKTDKLGAFKYLYDYSIKNAYVKYKAIKQNIKWDAENTKHPLEITINLSKPEKSLSDIKKAFTAKINYPKCVICPENMGYLGHGTIRQNLRGKGFAVTGGDWFFQYSPYGYFNEHGILINTTHTKMVVEKENVCRLLDFLDIIPDYFIGFNAALPIVGGSILAHDHYQGGRYTLPMMKSPALCTYKLKGNSTTIEALDWYNSAIRLRNKDRNQLLKVSSLIIESWKKYSDEENGIIAFSDGEEHNSITGVSRKENGEYVVELILRNNITSAEYPEGIFHAHPEYYNIKKEGIGLIEAAGMFILPARLKRQLSIVADKLAGIDNTWTEDMAVHKDMTDRLIKEFGTNNTKEEAEKIVKNEVNRVCENILFNTRVFKDTELGNKGFAKFLNSIGIEG